MATVDLKLELLATELELLVGLIRLHQLLEGQLTLEQLVNLRLLIL